MSQVGFKYYFFHLFKFIYISSQIAQEHLTIFRDSWACNLIEDPTKSDNHEKR
jgi:hypothetical protein